MGITDKAMREALGLIIGGAKASKKGAAAAKPVRPKLPPKPKPRITDEEIDNILAEGGLTRQDLRTRYPEVGAPVPAKDPKTGKSYMAKGPSREAEAVAKVRKRLQEEIKRGDYDRLYDPSARYNANPSNYDRPDVTGSIVPVRADTRAKYDALYAGPETAQRLDDAAGEDRDRRQGEQQARYDRQVRNPVPLRIAKRPRADEEIERERKGLPIRCTLSPQTTVNKTRA